MVNTGGKNIIGNDNTNNKDGLLYQLITLENVKNYDRKVFHKFFVSRWDSSESQKLATY